MSDRQPKTSTGRKCSICSHAAAKKINSEVRAGRSFRGISLKYGMSDTSVGRHAENCLGLSLRAVIEQGKIAQAIDVHAEFEEQLAFAKKLRYAAEEYLSDTHDPLKLALLPRADEIDVVYFDWSDMVGGESGQPKKKTAVLAQLLATLKHGTFEPDKVTIKHVDIRKFALDALDKADMCIDKFAKLSGAYQQDRRNETDIQKVADALRAWLVKYPDATLDQRQEWLGWFAEGSNLKASEIARHLTEFDLITVETTQ